MTQQSDRKVLALYRSLLRAAYNYPSRKRPSIINEIKQEFRAGRLETGPKLQDRLQESNMALKELTRFQNLDHSSSTWTISLFDGQKGKN